MSTMTNDPTAFQPMKVTASKKTEVGFEVEPVTKKITLDKVRIYGSYHRGALWPKPEGKNLHTDYGAAAAMGLPYPIIMGDQLTEIVAEMLIKFFGKGYIGGSISIDVTRRMEVGSEITVKGIVREKVAEGDATRLILDVRGVNQDGFEVGHGTISGLVH